MKKIVEEFRDFWKENLEEKYEALPPESAFQKDRYYYMINETKMIELKDRAVFLFTPGSLHYTMLGTNYKSYKQLYDMKIDLYTTDGREVSFIEDTILEILFDDRKGINPTDHIQYMFLREETLNYDEARLVFYPTFNFELESYVVK